MNTHFSGPLRPSRAGRSKRRRPTNWTAGFRSVGRILPKPRLRRNGRKLAVWRTTDRGAPWSSLREGLPSGDAFVGVLRESMARDDLQPFGLYFGTSTGQLFASADEGGSWRRMADLLPPITSVETALVDA